MIVSDLIKAVADEFTVDTKFLLGHSRPSFILPARFALYTVMVLRGISRARTGTLCNGRDHTTIMNGLARAQKMMEENPAYKAKIERLVALKSRPVPSYLVKDVDSRSHKHTYTDYYEAEFG